MAQNDKAIIDLPIFCDRSIQKLSPREIEVLEWTACGKTCFEIGKVLALSEETVRTYIKTACRKLNANNKTHAAAISLSCGLIKLAGLVPAVAVPAPVASEETAKL